MSKPFFADGTPAMVELEKMIDKVGIRNVLFAMGRICVCKEDHIRANWQDDRLANQWVNAGKQLSDFGCKFHNPG